jgi:hypothetical protein
MIRTILKILLITFLHTSFSLAANYPNIPNDIDITKRTFCDKGGKKFGHTIVLLDLTSKLDKAQIDFVKDQVYSNEFYLERDPFTKFSYLSIDKKRPQEQKFSFSKCRPKSGNSTPKIESATFFENKRILKKFYEDFKKDALKNHAEVYQTDFTSDYSFIYETVAYIFQSSKLDFSKKVGQRELIIVSDMMQHSKRLSFYKECNANSSNAKCPTFKSFMKNLSDKDYLTATAPKGKGVKLKIIYLNNRYETSKEIDKTLVELWKNYFIDRGFGNVEIVRQLDIQ